MSAKVFICLSMFTGLIEGAMARAIADCVNTDDVTEIRMRVNRPLIVHTVGGRIAVKNGSIPYVVSRRDIDRVLGVATEYSLYSVNDELIRGYIPFKSARIGVAGEGVADKGKLLSVKDISYLAIRLPHQISGAADSVIGRVMDNGIKNTLIVSPPAAGKTTVLRELARRVSSDYNVVIIDERYELAAINGGTPSLDVGNADVISGVPKTVAYENCVRALNPDVIVTDELFGAEEVKAVCDIVRSGVGVFASVHAQDCDELRKSAIFCPLLECFDIAAIYTKRPSAGTLVKVENLAHYYE